MPKERKAVIAHYTPARTPRDEDDAAGIRDAETSLVEHDELTTLLNDDWRVMSVAPLGGAGNGRLGFASLVVLEREEQKTVGGFTAG